MPFCTPSEAVPRKWDLVSQNETQGAFATIPQFSSFVNNRFFVKNRVTSAISV
jgi:hypothetical protein